MFAIAITWRLSSDSSINFYIFIYFSQTINTFETKLDRNVTSVVLSILFDFGLQSFVQFHVR